MNAFDSMPDCSAEREALTSQHQEVLTSLVARYEILVSIQDRIVEHDRRFGLASEVDEGLLDRLFVSLGKARTALIREVG
ncbi:MULTISPECIES: hypothetical protein [Mesorhizobium]|uniref:hypothetical protein n=1 Tax=Mesorhizobium TaxID=68287 RepID=UPI001140CDCF|nr:MULTISPECIES: hypothetical protein [Mesorhizobium]QIA25479.1 hypothetical protein A9K68_030005 [Mesorhizobium sp. AA22]